MDKRNMLMSEAASILGVSVTKIYRLARTKSFPALGVGQNKIVFTDDLMDWLHKNNPTTYCNR